MIHKITATDHKVVKEISALKEKKYRERYGAFLVEGAMSVLWALDSAYQVKSIVISQDFSLPQTISALLANIPVYRVPDRLFTKMSDTKTPQGILCVCALPQTPPLPTKGMYLYCDKVQDPGNVGTMIRTADAMGFSGVMLSPECVDPYNPKLVRSTMGSLFHIQIFTDITPEVLTTMQGCGFTLVVSALHTRSLSVENWQPMANTIVAVGNEAKGVSDPILHLADTIVKIPMAGSAESLNVAAAASILMYEAAQKGGLL